MLYIIHICMHSMCVLCLCMRCVVVFSIRPDIPTPWALTHFCSRCVVVSFLRIFLHLIVRSFHRFNVSKALVCFIWASFMHLVFSSRLQTKGKEIHYKNTYERKKKRRAKTNTQPNHGKSGWNERRTKQKKMMKSRRKWKYDRKNGVKQNQWKSLEQFQQFQIKGNVT